MLIIRFDQEKSYLNSIPAIKRKLKLASYVVLRDAISIIIIDNQALLPFQWYNH
jgi:hypothetical protein